MGGYEELDFLIGIGENTFMLLSKDKSVNSLSPNQLHLLRLRIVIGWHSDYETACTNRNCAAARSWEQRAPFGSALRLGHQNSVRPPRKILAISHISAYMSACICAHICNFSYERSYECSQACCSSIIESRGNVGVILVTSH